MKVDKLVIWSLVILVIFFAILGLIYWLLEPKVGTTANPEAYQVKYNDLAIWSPILPTDNPDRNTCQLYKFPNEIDPDNCVKNTCRGYPAVPTTDPSVVDQLNPSNLIGCYDIDQLVLFQGSHTCIPTEPNTDALSTCVYSDGSPADVGETEVLYTSVGKIIDDEELKTLRCNGNPCGGNLALFALNYSVAPNDPQQEQPASSPAENDIVCLETQIAIEPGDPEVRINNCDLSNVSQIVRVDRTGTDTTSGDGGTMTTTNNRTGYYASIYFRQHGSYLNLDDNNQPTLNGDAGHNWLLLPKQVGNCRFATDQNPCVAPQQAVYIGNLTSDQINQIIGRTQGATMDNINDLGLRSLFVTTTGDPSGDLTTTLYSIFTDPDTGHNTPYSRVTSQYIDTQLYNQILFTPIPYSFQ